jgi:hypothetical protein
VFYGDEQNDVSDTSTRETPPSDKRKAREPTKRKPGKKASTTEVARSGKRKRTEPKLYHIEEMLKLLRDGKEARAEEDRHRMEVLESMHNDKMKLMSSLIGVLNSISDNC